MKEKTVMLGAVAHAPVVVEIWEGIKEYFQSKQFDLDFVLFSNYDAQIDALLNGFIEIAWNTPLAFAKLDLKLNGKARLLAMRDTDIDFKSMIVSHKNKFSSLADLKDKTIAFGSKDSAQAALMPEYFLSVAGLRADKDYKPLRFNSDVGKQGDTGTSELEVLNALKTGQADAGCFGAFTWAELGRSETELTAFWTSPGFSHCVFNALPKTDETLCKRFTDIILAMDNNVPFERKLIELEGLNKQWVPASRDGYTQLFEAVKMLNYAEDAMTVSSKA